MRPHGRPEVLEQRRKRAIRLFESNVLQHVIARQCSVNERTVRLWIAAYRKRGEAGIKARPVPGRPSRLTAKQKERLSADLLAGPKECGFSAELWTCRLLAEHLRATMDISYHPAHLGRLLHAMGWSVQRPQRQARERDEKAVAHWRRVEWRRIKKKRKN